MQHSYNILGRAICVVLLTSACFTVSAASTTEENFPALDSSYLKTGDFIGPDHVKRITQSLNKDQVRLELGSPHFSEGIFGVHEWNYAFNFYTGKGNEYVTCQYKVKFDSKDRVESTHWKNADCENYVNPPQEKAASVAPIPPTRSHIAFSESGLFAFGKSGINDLKVPGREKLDALVTHIKQDSISLSSVNVAGYTDRIGSEADNLTLSKARAETVRSYLIRNGLDDKLVQATGLGAAHPITECAGNNVTPQLVKCLQPNRRVEIELVGEQ
ncbi:OmpA family protein [Collimonas sp. NPDC087041]|uniref:OmpA family protein n=1 Tax=Collimonas sp. NPDC087041 TaxID=3363960 RepID=UPI0037FD00BA